MLHCDAITRFGNKLVDVIFVHYNNQGIFVNYNLACIYIHRDLIVKDIFRERYRKAHIRGLNKRNRSGKDEVSVNKPVKP